MPQARLLASARKDSNISTEIILDFKKQTYGRKLGKGTVVWVRLGKNGLKTPILYRRTGNSLEKETRKLLSPEKMLQKTAFQLWGRQHTAFPLPKPLVPVPGYPVIGGVPQKTGHQHKTIK
jgi:hypothetical protein